MNGEEEKTCNQDEVKTNVKCNYATQVAYGQFRPDKYFYPQTLNSNIHPIVKSFFEMDLNHIASRYIQLNPFVDIVKLKECLSYKPKYFKWSGSDLFNVTNNAGKRQMIIIESNSCPSGQKSMPLLDKNNRLGGYKTILEQCFKELIENDLSSSQVENGELAIIYDQNFMESSGFCAVLAELTGQKVWLAPYLENETEATSAVKWSSDGVMHVRDESNKWHPIRACLRYVTQKPWKRIPIKTKTKVVNPIIVCLAGGRNKIMAVHAYKSLNEELASSGLNIRTPKTVVDLTKSEISECIKQMGGRGVVKVPYGNCGDGVYTISNQHELESFLEMDHFYDKFLVQSMVGDRSWDSKASLHADNYYHIGTIPDSNNDIFVFDLRMVVTANENGFFPVSINGRRARKPLVKDNLENINSWEILGTNLSVKVDNQTWDTESKRVLLMDSEEFSHLGIGLDDLVDGFIQTILATIAIDKFCDKIMLENGDLNYEFLNRLNPDEKLLKEI